MKRSIEFLAEVTPAQDPSIRYDNARMAFATMAGALILARSINDQTLSDRILKTTAKQLIDSARRE
jgi:hypothetical protein